jgi:phage-related protein
MTNPQPADSRQRNLFSSEVRVMGNRLDNLMAFHAFERNSFHAALDAATASAKRWSWCLVS